MHHTPLHARAQVRMSWAAFEARDGQIAAARQLFEGAVRLDPSNQEVWAAYEECERAYGGGGAKAELVWERSQVCAIYKRPMHAPPAPCTL